MECKEHPDPCALKLPREDVTSDEHLSDNSAVHKNNIETKTQGDSSESTLPNESGDHNLIKDEYINTDIHVDEVSCITHTQGNTELEIGLEDLTLQGGNAADLHEINDHVLDSQCSVQNDTVTEPSAVIDKTRQDEPVDEVLSEQTHIENTGIQINDTSSQSSPEARSKPSSVYRIKWIQFREKRIAVITQNENGPCPLIAIINALLLRGRIHLPFILEHITADQLMEHIGDAIMLNIPKDLSGVHQLNYEQNMHDAISVLPKLQTGLDVNVRFTGVGHFEYTPECIIFDLLDLPLYHGWVVDPQCQETVAVIGSSGYNNLVEMIIANKGSSDPDLVTNALIAEQFLERSASQLTYHGLCELHNTMNDAEVAILFRNNHFITVIKTGDSLYQLVTDQGFLHEPRVVWETLTNIEGDGIFVDHQFVRVPPQDLSPYSSALPRDITEEQQISADYLVALSLQEEQKQQQVKETSWEEYKQNLVSPEENVTDLQLALRLQEEEACSQRSSRSNPPSSPDDNKKKNYCTIV